MQAVRTSKRIGYARVSTDEQNLELQIQALKSVGCDVIYTDSGISGGARARPGLNRAMRKLQPGDKLVVWRLDRLGRSLVHLVQMLDNLGEREIGFRSLCEHIDTSSSGGRLVFHMMAALAEFERALISERTRAGMAAARAQGKHVGRFPSLTREQCLEAQALLEQGVPEQAVAEHFAVTTRTLNRLIQRHCTQEQAAALPGTAPDESKEQAPAHAAEDRSEVCLAGSPP
ncbi:recombinase family protein [Alcaligenes sp. WGS1538]|uniref:recombinase family protein n=1 Tax=Alcaligenes sp. WGS1538 TaxID=3366811 RepID=UPI00372D7DAD